MRELILIACVVLSVPFVIKRPLLGVGIYIGANIIRPEMLFWGAKSGSYVFIVYYVLIIVSSFLKGYGGNFPRIINQQYLQMIWLLFAIWVSIIFTQYQTDRTDYYLIEFGKLVGMCAFIYIIVNEVDEVLKIQNILLGCFTFIGIWGIEQSFRGNERLEGLGGGSWGDSNSVAAVFVMFFPVALAKVYCSKSRKQFWISACISAIMVVVIILSKSRGGQLGLVASVAAYGFYSRSLKKIVLAFLLIAIVSAPFLSKEYIDRMMTMKTVNDSEETENSARSRLILWRAGLMVFSDNPLLGTGFLTYPQAKMKYEDRFSYLDDEFRNWVFRDNAKKVTHNTYIEIMSDCGVFGAIPYFLLVMGGIFTGFKARRLLAQFPEKSIQVKWLCGLCAGISGYAVCIFFIDTITDPFLYFQLVFIGILLKLICNKFDAKHINSSVILTPKGSQL
jgi:probable O-glycosylation ligase (exosortase A-associated)